MNGFDTEYVPSIDWYVPIFPTATSVLPRATNFVTAKPTWIVPAASPTRGTAVSPAAGPAVAASEARTTVTVTAATPAKRDRFMFSPLVGLRYESARPRLIRPRHA
jgi:hypothetical protein